MPQPLVYLLLALALLLPLVGAAVLRVVGPHLSQRVGVATASLMFALAVGSVLVLARSDVSSLQLGRLTLLLPVVAPAAVQVPTPGLSQAAPQATVASSPSTLAATPTRTPRPTATATASSTAAPPTASLPPVTATAEPTAVPAPTDVPPTVAAARTYTVEPGDSLRAIAAQFNVTVAALLEANNLTAAEADDLRPGDELRIP